MFINLHFGRLYTRRIVTCFIIAFLANFNGHVLRAQQISPPVAPSSFVARLMNIEAATSEVFRYNTTLHNGSGKTGIYELQADIPAGWLIAYRVDGTQVTSLNMEPGKSQDIAIEINAPAGTKPDKYKIPVKAVMGPESLTLNLEAVVKGTYSVELTTTSGRLTDEVTSGDQKEIHLVVKNTGSLPLKDIELSSQMPPNWECSFEPVKIQQLEPGKTSDVIAKVQIPDKTIAGDYAATFTAKNSNSNAQAVYRLVVNTSLLAGWLGILVILLSAGLVFYLIRKYGRR